MTEAPLSATPAFWSDMITMNEQERLSDIAGQRPVLLVFLRHFGCSFCREAIADIAKNRAAIEQRGVRIVMVHMAPERDTAERFFKKYKLFPIDHIADPERKFYEGFGLGQGSAQQLFGLMNWIRGFQAGIIEQHGFSYHGEEIGDGFQMPGVFVLHKGEVKKSYIHRFAYDRPDYVQIIVESGL
jgi:peroxiredoxin